MTDLKIIGLFLSFFLLYKFCLSFAVLLRFCRCWGLSWQIWHVSAFIKTRLLPELRRVLSCKLPAVFLHFPLEEKGPWGPFYQLRQVLAKGRHLLQILLKTLHVLYLQTNVRFKQDSFYRLIVC